MILFLNVLQNRGLSLTNSDQIRKVHNSFSRQVLQIVSAQINILLCSPCAHRQQMFEFDKEFQKKDDDVFHFVAYVPIAGRLYELDGLKDGPIDLGKCDQDDWLKSVKPVLDKRIQR